MTVTVTTTTRAKAPAAPPVEVLSERTVTLTERYPDKHERLAALRAMGPAERLGTYRAGGFSFNDCCMWASLYRDEVPILQGEFEFIAMTMPEFCE
jgi:hypothetical protein